MQANIDFETRSTVDLTKAGAHLYAEHPTTKVMCMAWSIGNSTPQLWWAGDLFPEALRQHILAGREMHAWNAAFERLIWPIMERDWGAPPVALEQWRCTMVRALLQGFPASLEHAGPSMGLGQCKDAEGHRLMLQVSKPRNTIVPGDKTYREALDAATRLEILGLDPLPEYELVELGDGRQKVVQWWVDRVRMDRLGTYCQQDVAVELAAGEFLDPIPEMELEGWRLDQKINDRGFWVDHELVDAAKDLMAPALVAANQKLAKLTGDQLKHVTKPNEIRAWLNDRLGLALDSISKDELNILQAEHPALDPSQPGYDETAHDVIKLRLAAAKTSTAKLNSLRNMTQGLDYLRGGLQYAGAGRTNRWCLAEGTEVLCKSRLTGDVLWVRIEDVTTEYYVHDGDDWVDHEGSVYSGDKAVIEHDGLTATPEHQVWVSPHRKVPLSEAKHHGLSIWKPPSTFTQ